MRIRESRLLASLRSVDCFVEHFAPRLGRISGCGAHLKLRAALAAADGHATAQESARLSAQIATRRLHALRTALLRDHFAPLVALTSAEPDLSAPSSPYRMPRRWAGVEELVAYAEGLARSAGSHEDRFVCAGLSAGFADRMVAAAQALLRQAVQRRQIQADRVSATRGLAESIRRGRRYATVIGAMVRSAATRDPALLEAWRVALRAGGRVARQETAAANAESGLVSSVRSIGLVLSTTVAQPGRSSDRPSSLARIRRAMQSLRGVAAPSVRSARPALAVLRPAVASPAR